jgi:cell filamentation protein
MRDCYAENDSYTYPGVSVLRNRLGIFDADELEKQERIRVALRLLKDSGPPRTFDYTHFRALHFYMFQDIYDWAGLERTVAISKGGSVFAYPAHIRKQGLRIMAELRTGVLDAARSKELFSSKLCAFVSEMNALHPFREGNGRVLREFIAELARAAGYGVASGVLKDASRWLGASIECFRGQEREMADLLTDMLTAGSKRPGNPFSLRPDERLRLCSRMKTSNYPDEIKWEYRATLRC